MLGELAPLPELPDVLLDQLRSAVVVVEHREGAVEHGVVEPAHTQVEREQRLDGQQDKPVDQRPQERADRALLDRVLRLRQVSQHQPLAFEDLG